MMKQFSQYEVTENNESSGKKLIYQIPFAYVEQLSTILKELESNFGQVAYIDVEVNTLEDAYINIAKEEDRLLRKLK